MHTDEHDYNIWLATSFMPFMPIADYSWLTSYASSKWQRIAPKLRRTAQKIDKIVWRANGRHRLVTNG